MGINNLSNGKSIKKILVVLIISFFIFCIIFISNRYQNSKKDRFPHISTNDLHQGYVINITVNRGTIYFKLKNFNNFSTVDTRNYEYTPYYIDEFISPGDSIVKPANSDTLFVYRGNKIYFFILGKFINKKTK